jgi:DNA repair protein RadC
VIVIEDMFRGTVNGASVYPREVAKAALVNAGVKARLFAAV